MVTLCFDFFHYQVLGKIDEFSKLGLTAIAKQSPTHQAFIIEINLNFDIPLQFFESSWISNFLSVVISTKN